MRFIFRAEPISTKTVIQVGDYELREYTLRVGPSQRGSLDSATPTQAAYLTVAEASRITGIPARVLRRLVQSGQVRGSKVGGRWRLSRESLERVLDGDSERGND